MHNIFKTTAIIFAASALAACSTFDYDPGQIDSAGMDLPTIGSPNTASAASAPMVPTLALMAIAPTGDYTLEQDISYGELPKQTLDIYTPVNAVDDAPIVVFIHGGGWRGGSKDKYEFIGQSFTKAGYTVVVPNYRLYPQVKFPEFVNDAAKVVAFTQKRFGKPMVVTGHSAGAQIASLVVLDERYLQAQGITPCRAISGWAGFAGPYDFKVFQEPYTSIFPRAARTDMLPITFANSAEIPSLLLVGKADTTVKPDQTRRMEAALDLSGTHTNALYVDNKTHGGILAAMSISPRPDSSPVRPTMMKFVAEHGEPSCEGN